MAVFQVVVDKSIPFQGKVEEFSNVYHLVTDLAEPFNDEAAIDSIVALERNIHSSGVRFLSGSTAEMAGSRPGATRFSKTLTGGGDLAALTIYSECAVYISWELPRGGVFGFGRRRFLKKWLHTGTLEMGVTPLPSMEVEGGRAPIASSSIDVFLTQYAVPLAETEHGGGLLAAPNGDRPSAAPAVKPYLEHRQFHR